MLRSSRKVVMVAHFIICRPALPDHQRGVSPECVCIDVMDFIIMEGSECLRLRTLLGKVRTRSSSSSGIEPGGDASERDASERDDPEISVEASLNSSSSMTCIPEFSFFRL